MVDLTARERALIARMERAPDFGYDDEAAELSRLLSARGLRWRWTVGAGGREFVDVWAPLPFAVREVTS